MSAATPLKYLASPYTHADPMVMEERFQLVCECAARLFREGHFVFSPIAHMHSIAQFGLPTESNWYRPYNEAMLEICDELWVCTLDGWQESQGVLDEIAYFENSGRFKLVRYIDP